jgi:tape measure domain-containing protein
MSEFIEVLSPSALKDLQTLNNELLKTVSSVKEINANLLNTKTPSGSDNAIKNLTVEYQKQEATIKRLSKLTSEEIVNQRALRQNADRNAQAQSKLAGAYANLSAQTAIASKRLQDLIARGKTAEQTQRQFNREVRQASIEFRNYQSRVLQADKAVDKWNRTNERTIGLGRDLLGAFGVVGGVTAFAMITRDVFNQTKEIQSLNNALLLVTGTQENFYKQQVFLSDISERYGVELNSLTKQFTQFYISAKDKLAGKEIQQIFESITKAGASMGLSVENQQRAFLALNQMMSKGTIQAEELRGQLGEALPGAFGIMAKAVGVTEQELAKMMKAGELLASDVLPKFARQLEKTYGIENLHKVESLTASQNRLTNAWTNFIKEIETGDNKISNFFKGAIDLATSFLNLISEPKKGIDIVNENESRGQIDILEELETIKKQGIQTDKELLETAKLKRDYAQKQVEAYEWELNALTQYGKEQQKIMTDAQKGNPYFYANTKEFKDAKVNIKENNEKIKELAVSYGFYKGVVKGTLEFQKEMNQQNKKEAETIKETEEEREKRIKKLREEYIERTKIEELEAKSFTKDGYLKKLKEQKRAFEILQAQLSDTSDEYKRFQDVIDGLTQSIDLIEDPSKVIKSDGINEFMKIYSNRVKTGLDETKGFWEKYGQEVTDLSQELINTLAEISNARFENQLINLQKERDVAILFAGESVSAREEVERQYEARRAEIQRKQAEAQKKMAMFNIVTDTAQAVIASFIRDPTGVLAILIGAIGAAQLALVASQPIPQFWQGTDNAPEGLAWTQEKGREIITDKSGKIKSLGSDKGAQLTMLDKGDKVFTAEKSALMFDNGLNSILANNGISMPKIEVNFETEKITNEIKSLSNAILKKEGLTIIKNAKGEKVYLRKQGEIKELLNSVINYKTINV